MKAYISKCVLGIFAFDEDGKLIDCEPFPKDPKRVAGLLKRSEDSLIDEEKRLIERLGDCEIIIEKESELEGVRVENPNIGGIALRSDIEGIAGKLNISSEELRKLTKDVSIILARSELKETLKQKDRIASQTIGALDNVDEILNLLSERLREWYSLHFPELDSAVGDHRKYAELVSNFVTRDGFRDVEFAEIASTSMGGELDRDDYAMIKEFAGDILRLYGLKESLDGYLESTMNDLAPNTTKLVGHTLASRLISLAGSLDNLARMPASRIQVLGAEKAMFRHIKHRSSPPKHGVIFQHPAVGKAPWWQRGKIARSLAGKIAMAARVDAFSREDIGERLKDEFLKRVEAVKRSCPEPPKKMRVIKASGREVARRKRKRRKR